MARWTEFVVAHRGRVLAVWLVLFVLGGFGAANLGGLLTNRFSVPGSESERGLELLEDRMGALRRRLHAGRRGRRRRGRARGGGGGGRARRREVEDGKAGPPQDAGAGVVYVQISTPLENQDAAQAHAGDARAIGDVEGCDDVPVRLSRDQPRHPGHLQRGPRARRVDRGADRSARDGVHVRDARRYRRSGRVRGRDDPGDARVRVDLRPRDGDGDLRDQHRRADRPRDRGRLLDARRVPLSARSSPTPRTRTRRCEPRWRPRAGRRCSRAPWSRSGLALLVFMPLPFMRSMGVGGLLVPLVSIAASATLLPALLAVMGRGVNRLRVDPAARARAARGEERDGLLAPASRPRSCAARCCGSRRRRADARARAARRSGSRSPAATTAGSRSRPSRPAACTCSRRRSARARSPRTSSSSTPHRAGGRERPGVVAAQERLVAELQRDPEIIAQTILARRAGRARAGPAGEPGRRRRPRDPDPRRRPPDAGEQPCDGPRRADPRGLRPGRPLPAPRRRCSQRRAARSASTSWTAPTARSRGSCSRCWWSPTCCSCARSAPWCCRPRRWS